MSPGVVSWNELRSCGGETRGVLECALMNFYGRCWDLDSANQVFIETVEKKELVWNEAIMVYLRNER
ncbi:hypothetical protein CRYUN_Cryun20dG0035000 [Craigia yunnanensis]